MGYDWAYVIVEEAYEWMEFEPPPAPEPPLLSVSYEVDLWDDNPDRLRPHELLGETTDNRTYKAMRMRTTIKDGRDDWSCNDVRSRNERRLHCGRARGTAQPVMYHDGRPVHMAQHVRQPHGSWKEHRRHQWKGSGRV